VAARCTGLCVTVHLYSLPAWLAVAVQIWTKSGPIVFEFLEKFSNWYPFDPSPNYCLILRQKIQNPFVWNKIKFGRENAVHSGCTGLCVTVHLYSLPAWLAVAVQLYSLPAWLAGAGYNDNREFVWAGVWVTYKGFIGCTSKDVLRPSSHPLTPNPWWITG
jgi:hypothetical protein